MLDLHTDCLLVLLLHLLHLLLGLLQAFLELLELLVLLARLLRVPSVRPLPGRARQEVQQGRGPVLPQTSFEVARRRGVHAPAELRADGRDGARASAHLCQRGDQTRDVRDAVCRLLVHQGTLRRSCGEVGRRVEHGGQDTAGIGRAHALLHRNGFREVEGELRLGEGLLAVIMRLLHQLALLLHGFEHLLSGLPGLLVGLLGLPHAGLGLPRLLHGVRSLRLRLHKEVVQAALALRGVARQEARLLRRPAGQVLLGDPLPRSPQRLMRVPGCVLRPCKRLRVRHPRRQAPAESRAVS
mmetsp:Transcript_64754/g.166637  ORF Transcript_64754/g.166637 Transcript_64754/m.166637 type:complete len:298 (-) Transcript_64754:719-1612(-)